MTEEDIIMKVTLTIEDNTEKVGLGTEFTRGYFKEGIAFEVANELKLKKVLATLVEAVLATYNGTFEEEEEEEEDQCEICGDRHKGCV